jgi:hypothetical protein
MIERAGHIRHGKHGVVNPGDPEVRSRETHSFIAQDTDTLAREQPFHARRVVGVIVIAEDRQRAKWETGCVVADDIRGCREISRRLGNVVTAQEQQVWLLVHDQFHGAVEISGAHGRTDMGVGDEPDAKFRPSGGGISDAEVAELDVAWRPVPRVPRDRSAAKEPGGDAGNHPARW